METVLDLNGVWKYKFDPAGTLALATALDDFKWRSMVIPQNWYRAGLDTSGGVCWFRKRVKLPLDYKGKQLLLHFSGVDYFCTVWVNGVLAGEHEGYFQSFDFNVTEKLRFDQENTITVRVDSPREEYPAVWPGNKRAIKGIFSHHDARPGGADPARGQEKNTGGIWNQVTLLAKNDVRVKQAKVAPVLLKNGDALLEIQIDLENFCRYPHLLDLKMVVSGYNFKMPQPVVLHKKVTVGSGTQTVSGVVTIRDARLWWSWDQGRPYLHYLTVLVEKDRQLLDEHKVRFGIREIKVNERREWFLNKKRLFVRGTNIIPTQWLSEYTLETIGRDLALVREANLNAVRVHAHVNRPELYAACDEAGIMVWQDFCMQWSYEESDAFKERAVSQLRDMITQLYNHPSIMVWCCHNEPSQNADTLDQLLYLTARQADSTRCCRAYSGTEEHAYPGWYEGQVAGFDAIPGQPLPTEFGAQALPGEKTLRKIFSPNELWPPEQKVWEYHNFQAFQTYSVARITQGTSIEDFIQNSQDYQYNLLKYAIETYRCARFSPITGYFQFMFMDPWPAITWSVVDYYREKKKGYRAVQLASQPILLHFSGVDKEGTRETLFDDLILINDYFKSFQQASLRIWLEGPDHQDVQSTVISVDVAPDSREAVFQPGKEWSLQGVTGTGDYMLKARLISEKGALLSENEEVIRVSAGTVPDNGRKPEVVRKERRDT